MGAAGPQQSGGLVHLLRPQVLQFEVQVDAGVLPEGLQVRNHIIGRGISPVDVRGHGLHADQLQLLGDVGVDLPGRQGDGTEVLDRHRDSRVSLERQPAGQHFVQHHAGGVDVAPGVDPVAPGLLRRDIVHGAQGLLGQGLGGVLQAGDAEIGHLHAAVPQDHDVLGLDVPVDDAPAVGVAQASHDLGDEVQGLPPVQLAPLLHILLQRDAVDELHHDIFRVTAPGHVVDRHDVGVGQLSDCLGLRVEPAAEILVLGQVGLQNLDSHQTVETVALRLVDHRHAACADALQDLIAVVQHLSNVLIHTSPPSLTASASARPSRCQTHPGSWKYPAGGRGTCPDRRRG